MDLFVVRHAIAEPARPGLSDADRRLTPRGRRRFAAVVSWLEALGVEFDAFYYSPWLRAVETMQALGPLMREQPVPTSYLTQSPTPALLNFLAVGRTVGVVGHEPFLTELVAWLVLGDPDRGESFVLKKGGVAWLEGEPRPGGMRLRALVPPKAVIAARRGQASASAGDSEGGADG